MGRTRTKPARGGNTWILMLLVILVMIPVNWLVEKVGLWALRSGFGHHPWGVAILGVLVPSVVLVLGGYEIWTRRQQRQRQQ